MGWEKSMFEEDDGTGREYFNRNFDELRPGTVNFCPPAGFRQHDIIPSLVEILVSGSGFDPYWLRFHIHAMITTTRPLPKPYVIKAKKDVMVIGGVTNSFLDDISGAEFMREWESNALRSLKQ
jgi:hypothetical protein